MNLAKVFIVTHIPAEFVSDREGVYEPVHVGRDAILEDCKDGALVQRKDLDVCLRLLGDNTGDNISSLNRYLNELTAHYWAWKNFDSIGTPFVGFCHYRRYFIFDDSIRLPTRKWLPQSEYYKFDFVHPDISRLASAEALRELLRTNDLLVPKPYDTRHLSGTSNSCRDRYVEMRYPEALYDLMVEEILRRHPAFEPEVVQHGRSGLHFMGNMFVMRKEHFFRYCEFVFPVLLDVTKAMRSRATLAVEVSPWSQRAPALLGEVLTSIFLSNLIRTEKSLRVKELAVAYVVATRPGVGPDTIGRHSTAIAARRLASECLVGATFGLLGRDAKVESRKLFDELTDCSRRSIAYDLVSLMLRAPGYLMRRAGRFWRHLRRGVGGAA